jgi:hypothetical protein
VPRLRRKTLGKAFDRSYDASPDTKPLDHLGSVIGSLWAGIAAINIGAALYMAPAAQFLVGIGDLIALVGLSATHKEYPVKDAGGHASALLGILFAAALVQERKRKKDFFLAEG